MTTPRKPRWSWIAVGLLLGVGVGFFLLVREPGQTLTAAGLEAARARWRSAGPDTYSMEIDTSGATEARHRIEVRDGNVVQMTTGGVAASPSAWEYWSVDGLFRFLETELANARQPQRAYGVAPGQVVVRVRYHDRWGYPEFFLRHVMGRGRGIEWQVVAFQPAMP